MDVDPEPNQNIDNRLLEPDICPFCLSNDFYKISEWLPKKCLYCGAIHIFGEWLSDG